MQEESQVDDIRRRQSQLWEELLELSHEVYSQASEAMKRWNEEFQNSAPEVKEYLMRALYILKGRDDTGRDDINVLFPGEEEATTLLTEFEAHQIRLVDLSRNFTLAIQGRLLDRVKSLWQGIKDNADYDPLLLSERLIDEVAELIEEINDLEPVELYSFAMTEPTIVVPQLVIGVSSRLTELVARNPYLLYDLSSRGFEEFIAEIFAGFGFMVELTARTRDGGRDIVAIRQEHDIQTKLLIECKKFSPDKPVGISYVRALYGIKVFERATKALLATTSYFSPEARQFERQVLYELELKDFYAVTQWARDYSSLIQMATNGRSA